MITVKTMKQIATSSVVPSYRSVSHLSHPSSRVLDRARVAAGFGRMSFSEARRQWLSDVYLTRHR
ncbi:MAG: hypothetical protein HC780_13220 [Leptolyngbyaceae cyanobacterium CSU_1_3]|nr:hypothetical protein [Leptolyngbyaceae cyanobacterium CSU_1_3]